MNDIFETEIIDIAPIEIQGNGIMGNGASSLTSEINFDSILLEIEI